MPEPVASKIETTGSVAAGENSGIVVGTVRTESPSPAQSTNASTVSTQREFIKVYQDAGVVGLSFLTLLALCVALALFTLRLLRMFQSLTASRDALEAARTTAIEKLTTSVLLLRQEFANSVQELRGEHAEKARRIDRLSDKVDEIRQSLR